MPSTSRHVKVSDTDFIKDFGRFTIGQMVQRHGLSARGIYQRRRYIEQQQGVSLTPPTKGGFVYQLDRHPAVVHLDLQDGIILIGSDSHYWPGIVTTAHRAFLEFIREYRPKFVIKNGDEADFPTISRHAPIQWEKRPSVESEVTNLQAMLSEIEKTAKGARLIWPLGNHDARFETRLATVAPEYAKVHGVHLKDHFPKWEACMGAFINRDVAVRHRPVSGGIYAARNNTLRAGMSTVHGHLHSLKVWPHSDYRGTRFGVDCGTMAEPYGPQFEVYTEMAPVDWRSGFVLLTFSKGRMLWPEPVWVSGQGEVQFRGKIHRV